MDSSRSPLNIIRFEVTLGSKTSCLKNLVQHQPGLFGDLHRTPSTNHSSECNLVLPLRALPDYKRYPVHTLYPPILGVLTTVTLIDSRRFPLYQISTLPPNTSQLHHLSLHQFPIFHLPCILIPPAPIPTCPQSTFKTYSITISQENPCILPRDLLFTYLLWVYRLQLGFHLLNI